MQRNEIAPLGIEPRFAAPKGATAMAKAKAQSDGGTTGPASSGPATDRDTTNGTTRPAVTSRKFPNGIPTEHLSGKGLDRTVKAQRYWAIISKRTGIVCAVCETRKRARLVVYGYDDSESWTVQRIAVRLIRGVR